MSSDRQEKFSGTKTVEAHLRFDETRLANYLDGHIEDFEGPLEIKRFKGGQSNPTYQLITPARNYVLRRKPPGELLPSAHAVDREFRVISAMHEIGFPVPKPYVLCEDPSVVGTMFYIMEMVEGRVFWDMSLPGLTPAERGAIYDSKISTLAKFQAFDYREVGLDGFGKTTDYFARQIHRWGKTYVVSETEKIEDMDRLNEWLPRNIPDDDAVSLIHGDYRMDNLIFHPNEPRVIAVLDWELATIGHPLGDFTYHLCPWLLPPIGERVSSLVGLDLPALGIPTEQQYTERYCELTGRDGIPNMDYYRAYTVWRIAAIYQGIIKRAEEGTAASSEAPTEADFVRTFAATAMEYARKAGL
ncbi:MAG: phosphotransferase family protein [Gammaproteobacteria bacterium]|jgi:aminoglycoside phosphotransferase (APT) family kinase protein|nr:phosphotransferase family protein [Gammaproteobacteria bacterium]